MASNTKKSFIRKLMERTRSDTPKTKSSDVTQNLEALRPPNVLKAVEPPSTANVPRLSVLSGLQGSEPLNPLRPKQTLQRLFARKYLDSDKPSGLQSLTFRLAQEQYDWNAAELGALNEIVQRESSWNPNAQNPTSTAFGLFQFLDSTWAGVGASKTSDPAGQIQAGLQYIMQRYGSPSAALEHHDRKGWY